MEERLALLAGTLASATRLRQRRGHGDFETEASSVAGQALDMADPEVRTQVRELLEHHQLLGERDWQFPANPWVMWDERLGEPIFTLLRSVRVDEREVQRRLQETPLPVLLTWTTPAMVLAALGLPHRSVTMPRWVLPTVAVGLAAVGLGVMVRWRD